MKATLLIPARFGSQRFAGKPLALIAGKPMIQHVYERAMLAKGIHAVYVATDDQRIADAVKHFGGQFVMTGADAESGTDRINDAAERLSIEDDELIINLQGDQPLINPETIQQIVELFDNPQRDFDMATLGYQITDPSELDDPKHVKMVFDRDNFALYFSRARIPFGRDTSDYPVFKHLGIYAYTKNFVSKFSSLPVGFLEGLEKLEQLRALENGLKIKTAISKFDSPEVDTLEDIHKCEILLKQA